MFKMRWNEEVTLEFVKLYLKHECLWDSNNEGYKSKRVRENAYREIIAEFEPKKVMTVPEVKLKIRSLRTTYVQTLHKTMKRTTEDVNYEPSLVWFHEMDRCLRPLIENRSFLNDSTQQTDVDSSCQLLWVQSDAPEQTEELKPDPLDEDRNYTTDRNSSIKQERSSSPKYCDIKRIKYMNRTQNNDCFVQEQNTETTSSNKPVQSTEDEFDIYGKFIASQLRQMDLKKALQLQLEIQGLVSKHRMSDL